MAMRLDNPGFSDALVILGAAGIVIPAFARFRISPVIGFILVGMLVGPFGLGRFVHEAPWLYYVTISEPHAIEPFAEFGIILLLFSIGLELSFKRLWTMRRLVFGTGAAELIGSAAILGVAFHLIGQGWPGAIGLGLAVSLSSTALVLPLVGTTSPVGRAAFAMLLFEDLALVPIIFALGAMAPNAGGGLAEVGATALRGLLTVAAANILAAPLAAGEDVDPLLAKVQARRMPAVRVIQGLQRTIHRRVIGAALAGRVERAPAALRMLSAVPMLQRLPARILGLGVRREHIRSPASGARA